MLAAIAAVTKWEESWEDPGSRFQEWLRDCVLRAVRGFCQQGKLGSLNREESVQVYRKAVNVVLDNEHKASLSCSILHAPPNALLCVVLCQGNLLHHHITPKNACVAEDRREVNAWMAGAGSSVVMRMRFL